MVETRGSLKRARSEKLGHVEGVVINYMSRLPAKSILSYKTVSKLWKGLTSDEYFAQNHFSISREKTPSFITCPVMDARMKFYSINPRNFELSSLNTINPSERKYGNYMYMIASFNGLVCCINHFNGNGLWNKFCNLQIWICNPCTGEILLLPQGQPSFEVEPSVGVGYDSNSSDYRVFRIFRKEGGYIDYVEEEGETNPVYRDFYECEVYYSKTGSWENIGLVPRGPMLSCLSPFRSSHVFVEGKMFWLVSLDEPGGLLSVDMNGKCKLYNLPKYEDNIKEEDGITEATYLINLKGSVCLVILHPAYMDVWVLIIKGEEYDWENLWEVYAPFGDEDVEDQMVYAMTSSNNLILCVTEERWWIFDVDTGEWKSEMAPDDEFDNPSVLPFTESLLPCKGGVIL